MGPWEGPPRRDPAESQGGKGGPWRTEESLVGVFKEIKKEEMKTESNEGP
jgi:hypothetical protein